MVDAYSRHRYEEAAALAREVIAERPDLPEAYEDLALALRQLERHGEAIEALRSALRRGARPRVAAPAARPRPRRGRAGPPRR